MRLIHESTNSSWYNFIIHFYFCLCYCNTQLVHIQLKEAENSPCPCNVVTYKVDIVVYGHVLAFAHVMCVQLDFNNVILFGMLLRATDTTLLFTFKVEQCFTLKPIKGLPWPRCSRTLCHIVVCFKGAQQRQQQHQQTAEQSWRHWFVEEGKYIK